MDVYWNRVGFNRGSLCVVLGFLVDGLGGWEGLGLDCICEITKS